MPSAPPCPAGLVLVDQVVRFDAGRPGELDLVYDIVFNEFVLLSELTLANAHYTKGDVYPGILHISLTGPPSQLQGSRKINFRGRVGRTACRSPKSSVSA